MKKQKAFYKNKQTYTPKQNDLQWQLQDVNGFSNPKDYLEQYQTSPQIAGEMLHEISLKYGDDICDMRIADLGCGTGMLGIAAALVGCDYVTMYDIDKEAIEIAQQNAEEMDLRDKVQFVLVDVNQLKDWTCLRKQYDIVLTNPPFGIRSEKGADINFLKSGINICNGCVYSLHKLNTKDYLIKFYQRNNIQNLNAFKIKYDLPKSYKFHKENNKVIDVICLEANVGDVCINE